MHDGWDNFFLADVGAAAALAGLIFVAVSINIEEILRYPWLPGRAASTIAILIAALIEGSLALVPDQTLRQLGIEILIVAGLVWFALLRVQRNAIRHPDYSTHTSPGRSVLVEQLGSLPALVAGIVLIADSSRGLGVLAFAILAAFVVAVANAWILLVEIRR